MTADEIIELERLLALPVKMNVEKQRADELTRKLIAASRGRTFEAIESRSLEHALTQG
jgi:hypothetical protein